MGLIERNLDIQHAQYQEKSFKRRRRRIGFEVGIALLRDSQPLRNGRLRQPFLLTKTLEDQRKMAECLDGVSHFVLRPDVQRQFNPLAMCRINSTVSVYYINKLQYVNADNNPWSVLSVAPETVMAGTFP